MLKETVLHYCPSNTEALKSEKSTNQVVTQNLICDAHRGPNIKNLRQMGFIDNSDVLCQVKYMLPFLVLRDYFRPLLIELLCSLFVPRCNFRLNFFLMVPVSMTHLERLVNFKHVFFFLTIGYKNITFLPPFDSCKTFMEPLGFFVVPKVKFKHRTLQTRFQITQLTQFQAAL